MQNIIDMTPDNFEEIIINTSKEKLVLVDFWADWCEPCKALTPILEKVAQDYTQHLLLAKVDCEAQQSISMQFGVRNLPTVILVKDSQPVDGFAGLKTEQEVREWLEQHLPSPEETLLQQAVEHLQTEDYNAAFPLVKEAHNLNPERADIKILLANIYVESGQTDSAKALIATVGLVDQDANYQAVISKIELAEQAADTPEIKALQQTLADEPDNLEIKVSLAVQLQQANKNEEALALLTQVLQQDFGFGEAKKYTLDIINALPDGDPLASKYRRKIYSMMY